MNTSKLGWWMLMCFTGRSLTSSNKWFWGDLCLFEYNTVLKLFLKEAGVGSRGITTLKQRMKFLQALHTFERWHITQQGKLRRGTVGMVQFLLCISLKLRGPEFSCMMFPMQPCPSRDEGANGCWWLEMIWRAVPWEGSLPCDGTGELQRGGRKGRKQADVQLAFFLVPLEGEADGETAAAPPLSGCSSGISLVKQEGFNSSSWHEETFNVSFL